MSDHVSNLAFIRARAGRSPELEAILNVLVAQSRQEPGCLNYSLQRSQTDADLWLLLGIWQSNEAMQAYFQRPHLQVFGSFIDSYLVRELDLHTFSGVPNSSGLERYRDWA